MQPSKAVWVTVEISNGKQIFYVSDEEPGTHDVTTRTIGIDPAPFSTYVELCTYLRTKGIDPPPEEYFAINAREIDYRRTEWTRRVPALTA